MTSNKWLIIGLLLLFNTAKAQVINWVAYEHQADIKVYFAQYKYEADVIIYKAKHKYQAKAKPGYWWWSDNGDEGREYDMERVNIIQVKYKHQADYVVYLTTNEWEIKLTDKYITEVWEH